MRMWIRQTWPALALAVVLVLAPTGARGVARTGGEHWVATWMASPTAGAPNDVFHDRTVRMIVHTSIGGKRLRVEFSNAYGKRSLRIGAAHVAIRAKGDAIVPGSDRELTFDGSPSVTVPPGAPVVSDPVNLTVAPVSDLVVSVYVPGRTGPATVHPLALQTTYISGPGNFAGAEKMPYKWTDTTWYWLTAVDVEAGPKTHAIVALGDSITEGFNAKPNTNNSWPSQLAARLQAKPRTAHLAVVNAGISGNRVLHSVDGPNALARLDRDVLARDGVKYVIVLEGINDLGFPDLPGAHGQQPVTAKQVIDGLRQIITRLHAHGLKVFGGTLTPFKGCFYYSRKGEAEREAINYWIRTSGAFDGVIDFDAALRNPKHPLHLLPAYDSGDHLHPNGKGYKVMADAVNLSLFR